MMETKDRKQKARIGLYTTGLKAYWPQFAGLRERLEGYGGCEGQTPLVE